MTELSSEARNINWLVGNFVDRVAGVKDAVVVSSDGLPMAVSSGLDRDGADRFAAVASGLIGLAYGAAGRFGGGAVTQVIIEMDNLWLFITTAGAGTHLAVLARQDVDAEVMAVAMGTLVQQVGQVLGTAPRSDGAEGPAEQT